MKYLELLPLGPEAAPGFVVHDGQVAHLYHLRSAGLLTSYLDKRSSGALPSEYGIYKTVKARSWPWL